MKRFHLLGLAHLPQSAKYLSCAFTQKNRKLAKMLIDLGHEVFFYGSEGSDVAEYCKSDRLHFIQTHTLSDIRKDYGDGDNRFEIGYDWTNTDFRHDFTSDRKTSTMKFLATCVEEINKVKREDDFLLCTQGAYHKIVADGVKLFLTCESGVGYRGSMKSWYRAFESAYIQNFSYGSENPFKSMNGNYYDRVIPNYFDERDIEYSAEKGDYYLFIGRMIKRKGVLTAIEAAKFTGKRLIIVGQGGIVLPDGTFTATDTPDFSVNIKGYPIEYRGFADVDHRKELMAHAIATFTPTEYLECFGGTHIESMLSGTPVLTTDFGVYGGTVINGVNGYRCDTLQDFVDGMEKVKSLDPMGVRLSATRYLMQNVAVEYDKWFIDLHNLWESAKDEDDKKEIRRKGWSRLEKKSVGNDEKKSV